MKTKKWTYYKVPAGGLSGLEIDPHTGIPSHIRYYRDNGDEFEISLDLKKWYPFGRTNYRTQKRFKMTKKDLFLELL